MSLNILAFSSIENYFASSVWYCRYTLPDEFKKANRILYLESNSSILVQTKDGHAGILDGNLERETLLATADIDPHMLVSCIFPVKF